MVFLVGSSVSEARSSTKAFTIHDDVIKWKHFQRYMPFARGIHRSPVNSPRKANDAELWCFFDLLQNKRLNKHSWGWWFQTPSRPLWRHCNAHLQSRRFHHKQSTEWKGFFISMIQFLGFHSYTCNQQDSTAAIYLWQGLFISEPFDY